MSSNILFFYGGPFSQWYPCTFKRGAVEFNCAEQYMMAEKARLFGDEESYMKIMRSTHPREQKSLGRAVKHFNIDVWNKYAPRIVESGNYLKFSQNPHLKKILKESGTMELVEASATDCVWGIGLGMDNPDRFDRSKWRGTNWLGKALMAVREAIEVIEAYESELLKREETKMSNEKKCKECGRVSIIYRPTNICDDCSNKRETRRAEDGLRSGPLNDFYTAVNPLFDNTIVPSYDPPSVSYDPSPSTFDGFSGGDGGFSGGGSSGEF